MSTSSKRTSWVSVVFYTLIAILILNFSIPALPEFPPVLFRHLIAGKDPFIPFGAEFSAFKPLLPPHEKVSFIMDYPFSPYGKTIQQLYTAQAYLVPTILSYEPGQRAAIIFCSNREIAERRMEETGYRLLLPLGDGKGIAIQKQ